MKKTRIIKAACLVLSAFALLTSCEKVSPEDTSAQSTEDESTATETRIIDLLAEGDKAYRIVRPERVTDEFMNEFTGIRRTIKDKTGVELEVHDDWHKPGDAIWQYEILVGHTNREESAMALDRIGNSEYIICVIGDKVVINANTDELVINAIKAFNSFVEDEESLKFADSFYITGKGLFPIDSVKINGVDINDYKIVIPSTSSFNTAVQRLTSYLEKNCAVSLEILTDKNEKTAHEIIIGKCRDNSAVYGYDDASVFCRDGNIYLGCGSNPSALTAVNVFISRYLTGTGDINSKISDDGKPVYESHTLEREKYIEDPSLLGMHWEGLWAPEAHMLDYQEKIDCLYTKNKDHIFTVSHRGDFLYYPENSIESYISVWKMGGDCIETDLHYTKDGVCVIMHDATLTRMTDVAKYKGKNGYPDSVNISDWTYEQLKVLTLKSGQGGDKAEATPYRIPTLEEVLKVAKGRFFLILDKQDQWKYCDIPGIQTASQNHIIYPLMEKTGNFESVLISYGHMTDHPFTADQALQVQKYVYDRTGVKMLFYLRGWTSGTASTYVKTLSEKTLSNSAILVNGAFDPTSSGTKTLIKNLKKNYPDSLFGGWTIDTNGYDCEQYWEEMYNLGMRSIMSNNMFGLVQYAATK